MCGIGGIMTRTGRLRGDAPALLERMAEAMRHRGPDDGSIWVGPGVGFAFRRLSINDLAASADPFTSEDGSITSICNGEIFNWRELREDLIRRGHRFRTEVDTEIIPHLYEEHGEDAFALLNGQFAVAVHDGRSEQLVLARDQLGSCRCTTRCWIPTSSSAPRPRLCSRTRGCLGRSISSASIRR